MDFTVITDNFTYFMIGRYPQGALGGVALTLYLALVSCVFALVDGVILGVASYLPYRPLRWLVRSYTHVMRGVPLLMVISCGTNLKLFISTVMVSVDQA